MGLLLFSLAFIQFTHIVDFMILMPLGPSLMRTLEIGPSEFSILVSSYTFAAGTSGLLGSLWIDRFDRKKALLTLYVGFALGTLACGLAQSYFALLTARVITGLFGGVMGSTVLAIVGDAVPAEKRGRAMGIVMMAFSAASVLGVPFSLYLANLWDWHAPFVFVALAAGLALGVAAKSIPPLRGHLAGPPRKTNLAEVALEPRRLRGLIVMAALVMGQFSVIPFLSPSFVLNGGLDESKLPLIYLTGGLATIVTSPIWGRFTDRKGPVPVLTAGVLISLIPFVWITHLGPSPAPLLLGVSTLLFVCMGGRMVPTMTLVQAQVEPAHRGAYMAIVSSVQQFMSALAAFLAGHIVVKNPAGHLDHYGVIGWGSCALGLIAIFAARPLRSSRAPFSTLAPEAVRRVGT